MGSCFYRNAVLGLRLRQKGSLIYHSLYRSTLHSTSISCVQKQQGAALKYSWAAHFSRLRSHFKHVQQCEFHMNSSHYHIFGTSTCMKSLGIHTRWFININTRDDWTNQEWELHWNSYITPLTCTSTRTSAWTCNSSIKGSEPEHSYFNSQNNSFLLFIQHNFIHLYYSIINSTSNHFKTANECTRQLFNCICLQLTNTYCCSLPV